MRGSRILAAATMTVAAAITPVSPALAGNNGDNHGKSTGSSATTSAVTGTVTDIETVTGTPADVGTVPGTVPGGTTGTDTFTGTITGAVTGTGTPGTGTPGTGTPGTVTPGTVTPGTVTPGTGTAAGVDDLNLLGASGGVAANATGNTVTSAGSSGRVAFIPDSAGPGQPVTVNADMATCRAGDATATAVSFPEGLFTGALAVTTRTATGLSGSYPVLESVAPGTYTVVVTCSSPSLGSEADSNFLRVTAGNTRDEGANSGGNDRDQDNDSDDDDGGGHGRGDSDGGDRCGSWWGDEEDRGSGGKNCRGGHGRGHGEDDGDGGDEGDGGYDGGDGRGGGDGGYGDGGYGGGNGSAPDTGFGGSVGMTTPETLLGAAFLVTGAGAGVYLLRRRRVNGDRA
ncbi:hypothetical protein PV392_02770 [Streptomyces sp. ME03-5709C]|nr:hypothetical protein [Streptomyces sp. ME03-5709C]